MALSLIGFRPICEIKNSVIYLKLVPLYRRPVPMIAVLYTGKLMSTKRDGGTRLEMCMQSVLVSYWSIVPIFEAAFPSRTPIAVKSWMDFRC